MAYTSRLLRAAGSYDAADPERGGSMAFISLVADDEATGAAAELLAADRTPRVASRSSSGSSRTGRTSTRHGGGSWSR
jgi:hypothetical protein